MRLLEHRLGRVHDAGVDVAERLKAEQRGGMIDIVEDEGRRLVDRRDARARRRVWLGPGMNRKRAEPRNSLGHFSLQSAFVNIAAILGQACADCKAENAAGGGAWNGRPR